MRQRSVLDDPAFQSAFLAVAHLVGRRGDRPLAQFREPAADAVALGRALGSDDRSTRAEALAAALERIARKLEQRRLA